MTPTRRYYARVYLTVDGPDDTAIAIVQNLVSWANDWLEGADEISGELIGEADTFVEEDDE